MVKAELSYNPYLLETQVSFNGDPPRINSLVEKYRSGKLQDWIDELPRVFYDEMNGYDFELAFTGTDLDFDELGKSLERAGIGANLVKLFRKGSIGSRSEKTREIAELLAWLGENPNKRFDWTSLYNENKELFEGSYPFVVIGNVSAIGSHPTDTELFEGIATSIEIVESADELRQTDLSSTPILLIIDRRSAKTMPHDLKELLGRNDISQDQLFFQINYDPEITERVIRDLGVSEPRIVSSPSDEQISRYLEVYPISERIHDSIEILREQVDELGRILEEENRQSAITNKDVHKKIRDLDDNLNRLKETSDRFANRGNLDFPKEFASAKATLMYDINHWRAKKTKIDKLDDAKRLSQEYEETALLQLEHFHQEVNRISRAECAKIKACVKKWYGHARYDDGFTADSPAEFPSLELSTPPIASKLMSIKSTRYVAPKEDFFENIGKLFGGASDTTQQKTILETVFYCEKWRNHVNSIISPIADSSIRESYATLNSYLDQLADAYLAHIDNLLRETSREKERVSAQLSKDELLLQIDNDWLSEFGDKLHAIERF